MLLLLLTSMVRVRTLMEHGLLHGCVAVQLYGFGQIVALQEMRGGILELLERQGGLGSS